MKMHFEGILSLQLKNLNLQDCVDGRHSLGKDNNQYDFCKEKCSSHSNYFHAVEQ